MSLDRDTILARFARWLDEALQAEEPPRGIPEEILHAPELPAVSDLYSVQAALTALTQEVKLQGRSFKQLSEAVAPALESQAAEARLEARGEVIDALLDLHDRLARGMEAADEAAKVLAVRPRRWPWSSAAPAREFEIVDALRQGYALTAARLHEILTGFELEEIECESRPFDARIMQAVDTEENADVPDGTVVAVYRRGYTANGNLYRAAQVRVAKQPVSRGA
jgi:GrpE